MEIRNLAENTEDFTGNVWLVKGGDETVLVDVGTGDAWDSIRELESVNKVVITHSHPDHVNNLSKVVENFSPEIYAFEPKNLSAEAEKLDEGDSLTLCGAELKVFHTSGHKDDSICIYSPEENILLTGDLIFPESSFGRTDLEEGDRDKLIKSIEKITELNVEAFYPGHDGAVTEDANKWIERSLEEARKRDPKYKG